MRHLLPVILLMLAGLSLQGQTQAEPLEGIVTYVTNQNVYARFTSTTLIDIGDTLFVRQGDQLIPALKVWEHSSISCACTPLSGIVVNAHDKVYFKPKLLTQAAMLVEPRDTLQQTVPLPAKSLTDTTTNTKIEKKNVQDVRGFLTVASYTNFSNTSGGNSQKMQYTFSLNAQNIGNSKLSAESYISFYHRDKEWSEIQHNVFNGLKIYNLNVSYRFSKHVNVLFGRKINPYISNMGAVDGLQFEMKYNNITIGLLGGTRPDYRDYSFNANLLQFGGFIAHEKKTKNGYFQTTVALIEQRNSGKTDRRFAYLQHTNSIVRNLTFFGSLEVDFYRLAFNSQDSTLKQDNAPKLSNLYLSLRYRATRKLSFSLSYSSRQNVVYYETYKSFIDKILDTQTLQGYSFQVNYRPFTKLSLGATAAYRFQKNDPRDSKNLYVYLTYSQVPALGISATLSTTLLQTGYLNGNIYSFGIDRDLVKGKLFAGLTYRYVDYRFNFSEQPVTQSIGEANLTWRVYKRISFSVYYEGTFEKVNQFNRIYGQLNWGF